VRTFDPKRVRADIPLLRRRIHDHPLVYLDSGSSALTPRPVIEAMSRYYELRHANVHRGVYQTAEEATAAYEGARVAVGSFIGALHPAEEVVFTKNTTEGFNLLARSWGASHLRAGDVVVLSEMEHHANLVPWFQLRDAIGIELRFLRVTDEFRLDLTDLDRTLDGARLLSITGMSNVLGTVTPLRALARAAHDHGALVAVDGAQLVAHGPTDVAALDVDFFIFSAHKMLGPTGIGAVWTRREVLETMPPFLGGGGMIADVSLDGFVPASDVSRFEAGTPPIAEAVGFHAAVRYLDSLGMTAIGAHERALTAEAIAQVQSHFGDKVRIIGPLDMTDRGAVVSLDVHGVHAHDVAQVLDEFGVCVRPGHHCAKPLMKRFGLVATARASFGPYSLASDVTVLIEGLERAVEMFG
jgi:cysteine desulfurase / selenocysteine lyase